MAVSYMDFTSPNVQFWYDVNTNTTFKKDNRNFINTLSIAQLNTLGNVSLLDIYLSRSNVVEPHIHQNATELVYCISGSAVVSIINPFTKKLLNFPIEPGQVANVPQGWPHYEIATVDNTHLLAIFDAPVPEFIGYSDMLRLTPPGVLAHTYCLNEQMVKETLAPITDTTVIGPPANCQPQQMQREPEAQPPYAPYPNEPQGYGPHGPFGPQFYPQQQQQYPQPFSYLQQPNPPYFF
ncbi:cupin domain-containing protein [Paenibacillus sp. ATY16]|uniref:cupin domain-containing protein n=1 Tax=Paenibacillus sp. ATY16 TaxID=1759312 RepID=UPI00200D3604|nr:cupin domain-containing protein [Paenibacillus sp. ATY16]